MGERKRNRPYGVEDVKFVYENYSKMTASEIGEEIGISKFQVAKIVSELRKQGVDLPKKVVRRQNPIITFMKEHLNLEPKEETPTKKSGRKK